MDQDTSSNTRRQRLEELLRLIAGAEESKRMSLEYDPQNRDFANSLDKLKRSYYEKLKRALYGLPEDSKIPTEEYS